MSSHRIKGYGWMNLIDIHDEAWQNKASLKLYYYYLDKVSVSYIYLKNKIIVLHGSDNKYRTYIAWHLCD